MYSLRRRYIKAGVFFGVLLGAMAAGLLFSPHVHAQGEYYQYIPSDDTIRVTGGILTTPGGLHRVDDTTFEGGVTISGNVSRIPDGNAATLTKPCQYTMKVEDIQGDLRQPGDQAGGAHKAFSNFKYNSNGTVGDDTGDSGCKAGNLPITFFGTVAIVNDSLTADILIHPDPDPRGGSGGNACPGSNAPAGYDCKTIPYGCPGSTAPKPTNPPSTPPQCPFQALNPTDEAAQPDLCPIDKSTSLRWLACPLVELGETVATGLDNFIDAYMQTGNEIFDPQHNDGYKKAWETFRTFGIGLVVISGLVMVISEALNLQIVDAYTIRKVLPRLVIAVIGISISWSLCQYLIGFFDMLGHAMGSIVYGSLGVAKGDVSIGNMIAAQLVAIGTGGLYGALALGPMGILSFLGTLVLAILIGAVVLVIRQAIIVAAVLIAPLAIASYILPNTSKLASFWWDTFIKMLLIYPIATGMIALCKAMGHITIGLNKPFSTIVGLIFFFAGYALLPVAFRLAGGAAATLGGIANDRSRGLFDRNKKFRQDLRSKRFNDARAGRGGYMGANLAGGVYRRATLPGGMSVTRRGRARFQSQSQIMTRAAADEALKNDNGFAAGNDDANALAVQAGMTRGRFLREYAQMQMNRDSSLTQEAANTQAQAALGDIENGYGAQMGSEVMRLSAFKARAASNKGYNTGTLEGDYQAIFSDAASLVKSGSLSLSDAAAIVKSNKERQEFSGLGFGATMGQIQKTMASGTVSSGETNALADEVLETAHPGLLMQARPETIKAMAPQMARRLDNTMRTGTKDEALRAAASLAGLYDEMGRTSPVKAKAMADGLFSMGVQDVHFGRGGQGRGQMVTVRELMERARDLPPDPSHGQQSFLEMRREYSNRYAADAADSASRTPTP